MGETERVEEPQPEAEPDEEVSAQRERVEVSKALQDAAQASDLGQFDEALRVIDTCDSHMKSKKQTPVSKALNLELEDARNRMRSRQAWEQGGRAETRDAFQMHAMQRCTNLMPSAGPVSKCSKSMYVSPTQDSWIQKSKSSRQ